MKQRCVGGPVGNGIKNSAECGKPRGPGIWQGAWALRKFASCTLLRFLESLPRKKNLL